MPYVDLPFVDKRRATRIVNWASAPAAQAWIDGFLALRHKKPTQESASTFTRFEYAYGRVASPRWFFREALFSAAVPAYPVGCYRVQLRYQHGFLNWNFSGCGRPLMDLLSRGNATGSGVARFVEWPAWRVFRPGRRLEFVPSYQIAVPVGLPAVQGVLCQVDLQDFRLRCYY